MSIFTMPSLGADMEEGTLIEWLVAPGATVARGDIVAVVETQKGAIEIEIFEAGEIVDLIAAPGQTLPVGAPLATIRAPGEVLEDTAEAPPEAVVAPEAAPEPAAPMMPATPDPAHAPAEEKASGILASPAAKARAAQAGIDLAGIAGSGPGGAVLLADVEAHLSTAPVQPEQPRTPATATAPKGKPGLDMAEMRRAIAAAMTRAKREIPHYYLSHRIDLQAAQDWMTAQNAERPPDERLLMGALLIRATVRALAKVPELNGRHEGADYIPSDTINCGMAVAMRGGGLIAPAIMDAQDKGLDGIMAAMRDLVARTRAGRLRNSEVTQGTLTVSSLGESGVDALFGVIYPPQVALVGFGSPRPEPVVQGGSVTARLCVTATLAADHRVSDGRRGATFLAEIDRLLQEPETL
ncbi:MAG: 2-oxo acid dehydrogenase subunit E2 [Rubellimicrobium sp.]|nr:2-oxo acid dehydrogenase subunit E2 [Rubellimicrobium sp.]